MHWVQALIVFLVSWWLVFLPSLSVGIRTHEESREEIVPGSEAGAPIKPMLMKKALWATIGAAIITLVMAIVIAVVAPG